MAAKSAGSGSSVPAKQSNFEGQTFEEVKKEVEEGVDAGSDEETVDKNYAPTVIYERIRDLDE